MSSTTRGAHPPAYAVDSLRPFKRFVCCKVSELCRGGCKPKRIATHVVALESKDGTLGISSLCDGCLLTMRDAAVIAEVVEEARTDE